MSIILHNAAVYTANAEQPRAEAVVIEKNRIRYVGDNSKALAYRTSTSNIIDAKGRTVLPGFNDSHYHLGMGTLSLDDLYLDDVTTLSELRDIIQRYAGENPKQAWIIGRRCSYDLDGAKPLTRQHLDAIESERPMVLYSLDVHTVWANTKALELGDILHGAKTQAGSEIVMASDGTASGELREPAAYNFVTDQRPTKSPEEVLQLYKRGIQLANSYGITSIHNMDDEDRNLAIYDALESVRVLHLRVNFPLWMKPETPLEDMELLKTWQATHHSERLRFGRVKVFMDGVIEATTALMVEPYAHVNTLGDALFSAEHFNDIAVRADKHGFQLSVHAIGDAAVKRTLNGYELAQQKNGVRDSRHRIEHIETLHPSDLHRFKELGVIASMQPLHAPHPHRGQYVFWMNCVGEKRYTWSFPWQTLREAGVMLAFNSDYPVVSQNPFLSIDAAINRQAWKEGLRNEAQTLEDTLDAYTKGGAYMEFAEDEKGQLKEGMLADVAMLNDDIFRVDKEAVKTMHTALTIFDGEIVYEK
ncbi:MAG: amidohydrolase [Trueperaceae bacterium]